jgi:Glycosyl transferase family 2
MIATLGRRRAKLERLLSGLLPQVDDADGQVTVDALWNNGERPVGRVRQDLLDHSRGEYVSFLDDDDEVPDYFVKRVLPLLDGADYIGWRQELWRDGRLERPVTHSLRFGKWVDMPEAFNRDITHFNPMRRALAVQGRFAGEHEWWSEDWAWARQIRGRVKTEHFVDEVMLFQRWDPADNTGPARRPADDPAQFTRLEVTSPHFSWHPASGGGG